MTDENFEKRVHESDGRGVVVTRSPEELAEVYAELDAQIKRIAERGNSPE